MHLLLDLQSVEPVGQLWAMMGKQLQLGRWQQQQRPVEACLPFVHGFHLAPLSQEREGMYSEDIAGGTGHPHFGWLVLVST